MPAWLTEDSQETKDFQALQDPEHEKHKAHFSHEFLASAAAGFVANEFQKRQEKVTGEESKHKVLIDSASALAAGFLTNLVETKGLDYLDKRKLEKAAKDKTVETIHVSEVDEWKNVKAQ
ncbi:hypothetical protein FIBSPDRAFT_872559 [Athelia psychrophila]|uniref:CipC-like antibiotic response protein n=1 Tax=Athelia psychrophila TaxID=1759441 RepID=A0A165ZDM4_9AGAM|nr:hypothetical protein FIBSPDRAFT_872559 [Fibularhizoctonia sp. CBS 109695]